MIGFARRKWSSLYSEIPDGFKRLAVVVGALSGIDFFILFNTKNDLSDLFADVPFPVITLLAGVGVAFAWLFFAAVGWLWSTRKLPKAIRWAAALASFGPVGYLIVTHTVRANTGQSHAGFGLMGCGLAFSGFIGFGLIILLTIVGWIRAGGFGQPHSNASNDSAKGGAYSRPENNLDHHYAVLGVNHADSIEDIKKAYREKIKQYHPDKVAGLGPKLRRVAEEESKAITSAYAIIMEERS